MKEKLYTIPVNDAFSRAWECPVCKMRETLEKDAIEYTLGPSYMEDDIREVTDRLGFCADHVRQLYAFQNRLGLALMLKTHMDKTIKDIEELTESGVKTKNSLFKKTVTDNPMSDYIGKLNTSCFVCERIDNTFERYLITVLHLYKTDAGFRSVFVQGHGFCTKHYGMLYDLAATQLSGEVRDNFYKDLNRLYIENMKRVRDDLDWFISKSDYRFANEPRKNSKDALPRSMIKTNSVCDIK